MKEADLVQIFEQIDPAIRRIGYYKAITDNPAVTEKSEGSFTGHTLLTANLSVQESLVHFLYRCWIDTHDAATIPRVTGHLGVNSNSELGKRVANTARSDEIIAVNLIRVEHYGHLLSDRSRVRRKRVDSEQPIPKINANQLTSLAEETVLILDELKFLSGRPRSNVGFHLRATEASCRKFWDLLPHLAAAEMQR